MEVEVGVEVEVELELELEGESCADVEDDGDPGSIPALPTISGMEA